MRVGLLAIFRHFLFSFKAKEIAWIFSNNNNKKISFSFFFFYQNLNPLQFKDTQGEHELFIAQFCNLGRNFDARKRSIQTDSSCSFPITLDTLRTNC